MVTNVVAELIIGINNDELFGQHLVLGAGGVLVEILKDAQVLLLPTSKDEVLHALQNLRCAPMFSGFRGKKPADLNAIADAVMAVLDYSQQYPVYELDINPLLALEHGVIAVDALVQLGQ